MVQNDGRVGDAEQALVSDQAPAGLAAPRVDPSRAAVARCIEIIREVSDGFLSEKYAVGQPLASFSERFACQQAAQAIEKEFALGTIEQCKLLGKPTPEQGAVE